MSKLIHSYKIDNGQSGKQYRSYSYSLYHRPFYSLKSKYYLDVAADEDGEHKQMISDVKVQSCSIDDLFGRICFKPFLMIQKERNADRLKELTEDERLSGYFAWDTTVYMDQSYFVPETEDYRFIVSAWHLNHVAACRRFLIHLCGEDLESKLPSSSNQSLVWVVTPNEASLHEFDSRAHKVGEVLYQHPHPMDLLLLMSAGNVFRHFYDWYAILTQLEGKRVAR